MARPHYVILWRTGSLRRGKWTRTKRLARLVEKSVTGALVRSCDCNELTAKGYCSTIFRETDH